MASSSDSLKLGILVSGRYSFGFWIHRTIQDGSDLLRIFNRLGPTLSAFSNPRRLWQPKQPSWATSCFPWLSTGAMGRKVWALWHIWQDAWTIFPWKMGRSQWTCFRKPSRTSACNLSDSSWDECATRTVSAEPWP